jgi:hypothetical protein
MTLEIGRTDPCPCESGKLYKDCHMRTFRPLEKFKVIPTRGERAVDFHMVRYKGTDKWVKQPGRLFVRLGHRDEDKEIEDLMKDLIDAIPENRFILFERAHRLKHKIYGIKHHIDNFVSEENRLISTFNNEYEAPSTETEYENPNLIYSVEGFLFQFKSALDIFAQIIAMVFNLGTINRYSYSEKKGNVLVRKLSEKSGLLAEELKTILKTYDRWIVETIDMRDEVTHFSDLRGFLCFVQHAWDGGKYAFISYPSMPDGKRASTYIQDTYKVLFDLLLKANMVIITKLRIN